jgi:hypothetical protein
MGEFSAIIMLMLMVASVGVIFNLPLEVRPDWLFVVPVILFGLTLVAMFR